MMDWESVLLKLLFLVVLPAAALGVGVWLQDRHPDWFDDGGHPRA